MDDTPRSANTEKKLSGLGHDNVDNGGEYSMLIDEHSVWLTQQKVGTLPSAEIKIDKETFNQFVDWYNTGKVPPNDSRHPKRKRRKARP